MSLKILVVDDEPSARALIKRLLERFGTVDEADNGLEAVLLFRSALMAAEPYDLVSLDVMMPGMDGQAALECMRGLEYTHRAARAAKILMISAVDHLNCIVSTSRHGADGYLVKPIKPLLVEAKCRKIFNLPLTGEQESLLAANVELTAGVSVD